MSVYGDREYRKRRAAAIRQARKDNADCSLCAGERGPIDWDAPAGQPLAPTADHTEAIANGGHLHGHITVAHHSCNSSKGKRAAPKRVKRPRTSRDWYSRPATP